MPGNYIIQNSPVHGIVYYANNNSVDTVHRLIVLFLSQGSPSEQFSWQILLKWKRCLSADSLYRHCCDKVSSPGHLFQRHCGIMGHVESQSTNEAVACSLLKNISSSVCGIQIIMLIMRKRRTLNFASQLGETNMTAGGAVILVNASRSKGCNL